MSTSFTIDSDLCVEHVRVKPSEQIGLHHHPQWELSCVVCGSGIRTIGQSQEPFRSGDVVLLSPDVPHQWAFDDKTVDRHGRIENVTLFFSDRQLARSLTTQATLRTVFDRLSRQHEAVVFSGTARRLIATLLCQLPDYPDSVRESALGLLLQLMATGQNLSDAPEHQRSARTFQSATVSAAPRDYARGRIAAIETYVHCNFMRDIPLDTIAAHVGMNRSSFCIFFKRQTGQTFTNYLTRYRIDQARYLLTHTDRSVSQICYECGFNDVPYFCRTFKKHTGSTPIQVRATR